MILTNSEIMDINQNAEFDSAIGFARAIESAVLEKLKAQKPFAFHSEEGLSYGNYYKDSIPLYEHPLPPADVVRDAERYRWLRDQVTHDGIAIVMKNKHIDDRKSYSENIDNFIDAAMKGMK